MRAVFTTYRSLWKRPAFFLAVVLTLTLGIGANSAIFSVIDAVLLKPLPYPNSDRLMALFESNARHKQPHASLAPIQIEDWDRMSQSFSAIAGGYVENVAESSGELPEMLVAGRVSPRFFSVLGTAPVMGRTFSPEEDLFNGPNAAVISEHLWRRRFGADPAVLGKILRFGRNSDPIIGVMPDSVRFPAGDVDLWTPAKLPPYVMTGARGARWDSAIGTDQSPIGHILHQEGFAPALQIAGVAADFRMHGPSSDPQPTIFWCGLPFNPFPEVLLKSIGDPMLLAEAVRRRIRQIEPTRAVYDVRRVNDYVSSTLTGRRFQMILLSSFAAMALLLAAVGLYGVTSFLVSLRTREIGLRAALGATPSRIFAQILREGALMTVAGIALGLAAALALTRYLASFLFGIPPTDPITFAAVPLLLACVSAVALWLPARRATQIDPMEALRLD